MGAVKSFVIPALVATAVTVLVLRFVRPVRDFALSASRV